MPFLCFLENFSGFQSQEYIPPLLEAAQSLRDEADSRAIAVFGYRDEHFADIYAAKYADEVHSIDEPEGNVLTLLERLWPALEESGRKTIILSCGPTPMMRAVATWASKRGVDPLRTLGKPV